MRGTSNPDGILGVLTILLALFLIQKLPETLKGGDGISGGTFVWSVPHFRLPLVGRFGKFLRFMCSILVAIGVTLQCELCVRWNLTELLTLYHIPVT